jgi:chromosome segregation ATPase
MRDRVYIIHQIRKDLNLLEKLKKKKLSPKEMESWKFEKEISELVEKWLFYKRQLNYATTYYEEIKKESLSLTEKIINKEEELIFQPTNRNLSDKIESLKTKKKAIEKEIKRVSSSKRQLTREIHKIEVKLKEKEENFEEFLQSHNLLKKRVSFF